MRRMRSRSSSNSMAIPAMTAFCRRPCSSTWATGRTSSASAPAARKASRHSLRVAAVTPCLRLVDSRSAPRSSSRTTLVLRLADHRPLPRPPISGPVEGARRATGADPEIEGLVLDVFHSLYRKSVSNEIVLRESQSPVPTVFGYNVEAFSTKGQTRMRR